MKKQQGFITLIILVIIALVVVKFVWNFSIFEAAGSPQGQSAIDYLKQILSAIWSVISSPVIWLWNNAVLPLINLFWQTFQAFLQWGKANAAAGIH